MSKLEMRLATDNIMSRYKPGAMLSMGSRPDLGPWLVVSCKVLAMAGAWYQVHLLLLRDSTLVNVEKESTELAQRWQVVHEP